MTNENHYDDRLNRTWISQAWIDYMCLGRIRAENQETLARVGIDPQWVVEQFRQDRNVKDILEALRQ